MAKTIGYSSPIDLEAMIQELRDSAIVVPADSDHASESPAVWAACQLLALCQPGGFDARAEIFGLGEVFDGPNKGLDPILDKITPAEALQLAAAAFTQLLVAGRRGLPRTSKEEVAKFEGE